MCIVLGNDLKFAPLKMKHLDEQMRRFSSRLRDDLNLTFEASNSLATTIFHEVGTFSEANKKSILNATPVQLNDRLAELEAFQGFVEIAKPLKKNPFMNRAHVLCQNYICFVYLGEVCFKLLRQKAPSNTAVKKCCKYLTNNPVRAFRNALAHGNWSYLPDFTGLDYWARKGDKPDDPICHYTVTQHELDFWQALSKCTAYSAYLSLNEK